MVLFKSRDQFLITPAIGLLREYGWYYLNISWLWFGLNMKLFKIEGR